MKKFQAFGISTKLIGAVLILAAATAPGLKAQFECKQELWAGTWVHHAELWILDREGADTDLFPPPGPFSEVGIYVIDQLGRVSVSRQTNSNSVAVSRSNFVPSFVIENTINPDCTGRSHWTLSNLPSDHPLISRFGLQSGETVFDFDLVCANGQRECSMTFTAPGAILIGIVQMKRVEPFDRQRLDDIHELIRRVALRVGLQP